MTKPQLEKVIERIANGRAFDARPTAREALRKMIKEREGGRKRKAVSRNDSHPSRSVKSYEKPHTPWEK